MKQESIGSDFAKAGSFSNETELQATVARICHQLGLESLFHQLVPDRLAYAPKMTVRVTAISATGS
jgi:hypothetical protein